jgi:hypothetical protein
MFKVLILFFLAGWWCLYLVVQLQRRRRHLLLYPPGPTPHPFVGHTFQVPKTKAWLYFQKLGEQYGKHIRVEVSNTNANVYIQDQL